MSWIEKLYETYEYCQPLIGRFETENDPILLPIAHTTQNAHIELCIDVDGNLIPGTAREIENKSDSVTIIPCTEKSQSRSGSNPVNHPLFDKLQYLAGDYVSFGGEKGEKFHEDYMDDLRQWCSSPYANQRACAVLKYLEKGTLIADLIGERILPLDENKKLIRKWDSKKYGEKRGVYKAGSALSDAMDAFVRIDVVDLEKVQENLWNDPELWNSFIAYYSSMDSSDDLCYVQGIPIPCAEMSPSKIRSTGDKAKLISSNDSSGFTYRGRFAEAGQVARIGYETTQKAHNALKWLIAKQGFHNGEQVYVTWGTKNEAMVPIENDSVSLMDMELGDHEGLPYVDTEYALKLNKLMAGYHQKIKDRDNIVTLGLDAATPGRMSIIYYEEIDGHTYLEKLYRWYSSCSWRLDYIKKDEKGRPVGVFGTPSPKDILFAVYGANISDKLKKSAMQRLMPCIWACKPIPRDFMLNAARRASQPVTMEEWEYRKTLCVACALIRKYYNESEKGEYTMAVETNNTERSYLFGRVLAYYHYIESVALFSANEKRPTNAMRLKNAYCQRPAKTMAILDNRVQPYINKLCFSMSKTINELEKVTDQINTTKMTDEPLAPTYLLGYSAQITELFNKKGE